MSERNWDADWAMCEKATPGPWYVIPPPKYPGSDWSIHIKPDAPWNSFDQIGHMRKNNAIFIAEARSALPYWLQRVKELEAENERRADTERLLNVEIGAHHREIARLRIVAEAAKRLRRMHVYDEKTNVHKRINDIVHIDAEEALFAAVDALEEASCDGS